MRVYQSGIKKGRKDRFKEKRVFTIIIEDELVESQKLDDSLATLPELGQRTQPGRKELQMHGKTREFLGMKRTLRCVGLAACPARELSQDFYEVVI